MADSLRYDAEVDLSNENNSQSLLVLMTGSDKKVLEVGPATGYVTRALTERGCLVTCIEIDADAAAVAEQYCEHMIVGDVQTMDFEATFKDERFDVVIFGDVLEHLLDPAEVLRKTAPILAPGGCVAASIPNVAHSSIRLSLLRGDFRYTEVGLLDRTHIRFFTRETIAELFEQAGYTVTAWQRTVLPPFGTDQELKAEDFPSFLAEWLSGDPEAETYQYIVRADPCAPSPSNGSAAKARDSSAGAGDAALRALWLRQDEIQRVKSELDASAERASTLENDLSTAYAQIYGLNQHVLAITGSIGYRLLERARRVLRFFLPPGSPQRVPFRILRRASRYRRLHGWRALLGKAIRFWEWPRFLSNPSGAPALRLALNEQYQLWLMRNALTPARLRDLRKRAQALTYRPLVSIVVPVYNPDPSWLRDAVESVRSQIYDNWELCLADDCSTRDGVHKTLREYAAQDARIKVTFRDANGGISAASNSALELATGEFIGLLDHDDEITPDALLEVVSLLNKQPDLDYIYTDEDKKDPDGRRIDPFFKPDWSPDLHRCINYVTHFSVYRTNLVRELGGFTLGLEGSQDYDLVLRVTEQTSRIAHIAKQLYSWRMVPGSAAISTSAKDYAYTAAKRAISDHLRRTGTRARVADGFRKGYLRVQYELLDEPRVAIIIPTRDKVGMLRRCIDSIRNKSSYNNYEIIIINNQSSEPATLEYLRTFDGRVIDYPHEFNYAEQMNLGVKEAGCEYVLFLNNDTEVITPGWVEAMLEHAQRPEVGAVGVRLTYPDGRVQHEGVYIGCLGGTADHLDYRANDYFSLGDCVRDLSAVTAACMMTRASVYQEVGGFDSDLRVAYNDVDFCLKLREKGYLVIYTPFAELRHEEGGTRGRLHPQENEDLFRKRWRGFRDPYYNPNFDLDHPFSIKL